MIYIKSDFNGNGYDGYGDISATSLWGVEILKLAGNSLGAPMMAPNGTRFGGWLLNTVDNRFGLRGDFNGK